MRESDEKRLVRTTREGLDSVEVGNASWLLLILPLVVEVPNGNLPALLGVMVLCALLFVRRAWEGFRFDRGIGFFAVSMLALSSVQLLSCFEASSILALRFFAYSLATLVFVVLIGARMVKFNDDFILLTGSLAIIVCLLEGILGVREIVFQNTVSGELVFCWMGVLMAFVGKCEAVERPRAFIGWRLGMLLCSFACCVVFVVTAQARTALLVLGIMVVCTVLFRLGAPSRKFLNAFFLVFVGCAAIFLFVYAHARDFGWYDDLNGYSQMLFGKNIDSSRGGIWEQSLKRVQGSELLGLGADASPEGVYEGRSFHNTFVQAYVQNGLAGLFCLVSALFALWRMMTPASPDPVISIALSVLVGVVVYNCFESTLLSNKLSLGYIQWFLLAFGVARSFLVQRRKEEAK